MQSCALAYSCSVNSGAMPCGGAGSSVPRTGDVDGRRVICSSVAGGASRLLGLRSSPKAKDSETQIHLSHVRFPQMGSLRGRYCGGTYRACSRSPARRSSFPSLSVELCAISSIPAELQKATAKDAEADFLSEFPGF